MASDARLSRRLLGPAAVLLVCGLIFEIGCQLYTAIKLSPRMDHFLESPRFIYRRSENPILGYELLPDHELEGDRRLRINRWGIREEGEDLAEGQQRIAVLGDSVVFGFRHSQEDTISVLLQQEVDPAAERIRVFNFGVQGYALPQIVEFLKVKDAVYDVDAAIYLFNPNDYSRRNSQYEGADDGLYRIYHRPFFKSPWFVRKLIYRSKKGGAGASVGWYRWFYAGNKERGLEQLREMKAYSEAAGIELLVVLLPAPIAYQDGGYALADMYAEVAADLAREGVPVLDSAPAYGADPARYFDETTHLVHEGNLLMAQLMARLLREERVVRP